MNSAIGGKYDIWLVGMEREKNKKKRSTRVKNDDKQSLKVGAQNPTLLRFCENFDKSDAHAKHQREASKGRRQKRRENRLVPNGR